MLDLAGVDLLRPFRKELELCKLKEGESVVILTEPESRMDYAAAAFGAAKELGANVISATVSAGSTAPLPSTHTGAGPGLQSVLSDPTAQTLMKSADLVIDLTREGFIHAPLQQEILDTGTRILFVCDPPEVLIRNMASSDDKDRVTKGVELLQSARTMHVTSPVGTDLTVELPGSHPMFQVGYADDPGRWDHWPSTMVMCWPEISDGRIVLDENDVLLPFKEYVLSPITLEIVRGRITDISGGAQARMLAAFLDEGGDEWGRSMSHMGWGLMRTADWFATALYSKHELMGMDARAYAGNFLWSTGPHPVLQRESFAHVDVAMRGCTVSIDGVDVVLDGKLVD